MSFFRRNKTRMRQNGDVARPSPQENDLYTTDGPVGMKVIADPTNAQIDIIFVHGLTGNREKTWTHRNGTFWIHSLLPEDVPNARIMTFGYDADVAKLWSMASSNRLHDHGKSLAYAVLQMREGVQHRPMYFVSHSLGGLVTEAALILSDKRVELSSIVQNTKGIVFLGTPHGGADLANWGVTVARYVNLFRSTNGEIIRNLQPSSAGIQQVEDDFQHLLIKKNRKKVTLGVFCFYEELRMQGMGKIVEEYSAVIRGYGSCSIHADHRDMTKFSSRRDAGYGQVLAVLKRLIKESRRDERIGDATRPFHRGDSGGWANHGHYGVQILGTVHGRNVISGVQTTNGGTTNFTFN